MILKERLRKALESGAKTNKELKKLIPDKPLTIISATISNNQHLFVRLDRGYVGLRNRDEDKITGNEITPSFPLYKRMVNLLQGGEMSTKEMCALLPDQKPVSIRASVNMYPHLFIRLGNGMIGRRNRDEWLIEKYQQMEGQFIFDQGTLIGKLALALKKQPMTVRELCELISDHSKGSICGTLSKYDYFEKNAEGLWEVV